MDNDTIGLPLETILRKIAEPYRTAVEDQVTRMYNGWKGRFAENLQKVIDKRAEIKAARLAKFDADIAAGVGVYASKSPEDQAQGRHYAGMLHSGVNVPSVSAYGLAEAYMDFPKGSYESRKGYMQRKAAESMFSFVAEFKGGYMGEKEEAHIKPDLDATIEKEAKKQGEMAIEGFVRKSLSKFGSIVDAKGGAVKTFHYGMDSIRFVFDDGTTFLVTNSQILNVSVLGKVFNQWPTRFHDVVLADGTKVKIPSEKKLKELFVTHGDKKRASKAARIGGRE